MWRGFIRLSWLAVLAGDDHDGDHGYDDHDDNQYDAPLPDVKRLHPAELVGSFSR